MENVTISLMNSLCRHVCAALAIFAARDLRPVWFSEADIAAHTEREYRPR